MRTPPLLALVCALAWSQGTQAGTTSSLVEIACKRDPQLTFCKHSSPTRAKDDPVETDLVPMATGAVKIAGVKSRVARQDGEGKGADLREKDHHDSGEGFIAQRGEEDTEEEPPRGVKQEKDAYCDKYEQHFSFYCTGDPADGKQDVVAKFCPSYKRACPSRAGSIGPGRTSWPANPFTNTKPRIPVSSPVKSEDSEEEDEEPEVTEQDLYNAELKRRFPCKPDCDHRLFPHCTAECKCDYLYPMVQRFCNPPPMPLFLNTCRLWYNGCPKYEAYHYSSQFVYSKAEKGKRLPGQPQPLNPNPYNIPTPARYRTEAARLQPIARAATTLVIPPDLPENFEEIQRARSTQPEVRRTSRREEGDDEAVDVLEKVQRRKKTHRRRVHRKREQAPTTPSPREVYRGLKALNALTMDPARLTKDLVGHDGNDRPKAFAGTLPVQPSDAAYGTDETFKKFDGLTDSQGILHRPRSTSPFTKPGLWEPNPADPHSRDPTNKWAYHVRSTQADWLNGQLTWGAHWAVPAAGVGGTDGFSALHFPTVGTFLGIPDDYD